MTSNARELAQIPSTPSGRRNLLINGGMQVKQYGSPHTVANANRAFAADRFQFVNVTGSNQTVTNSTTSPSGFSNSLKIDVDTAVSGSDSGAYAYLGQKIEAQNLQHLDYGASGAKTITLSFYVRSPKTGIHVVELNAPDGSRHISGTYTVASANTWEEHSITFAGDASGTINNDTGIGLEIFFWLVAGSDLSGGGSLNTSWTTNPTANTRAVGQVNVFDNTSNVFYITGVQLEVGSVATEFEHRSFGDELALCQRYFQLGGGVGRSETTSTMSCQCFFHPTMRAAPSITVENTSLRCGQLGQALVNITSTSSAFMNTTNTSVGIVLNTSSTTLTAGQVAITAGDAFGFSAEL